MKHTRSELVEIIRELIMGDGLTAVTGSIVEVLLDARDAAYRDYETSSSRSSRDIAKAWEQDAVKVQALYEHFKDGKALDAKREEAWIASMG